MGPFSGVTSRAVNTLPVRVRLTPGEPFAACHARLQREEGERRTHDHSPLVHVQSWSELPSGTPLFDTIMTYLNVPGTGTPGGHEGRLCPAARRRAGARRISAVRGYCLDRIEERWIDMRPRSRHEAMREAAAEGVGG